MSNTTRCPYCNGEGFELKCIPAGPLVETVGNWYNKCLDCHQWSKYEDEPSVDKQSRQIKIENPKMRPKPWQL